MKRFCILLLVMSEFFIVGCSVVNYNRTNEQNQNEQDETKSDIASNYEDAIFNEIMEKSKQEEDAILKLKNLASQKCTIQGFKKGTAKFVLCSKARFDTIQKEVEYTYKKSYATAYSTMIQQQKEDEITCVDSGINKNTQEYKKCIALLDQIRMKKFINKLAAKARILDSIAINNYLSRF